MENKILKYLYKNQLICRIKRFSLFLMFFSMTFYADNNIHINKKNVDCVFVPFDAPTDHFVRNIFARWEEETFEVFDQVKDSNGIAIDLGAWIGTTAIWCAKNFSHVIAVDADRVSLNCLKNNLKASECFNVTICDRPVSAISKEFVFGSRSGTLNESISYIKNKVTNSSDYVVKGITFKQLIHDFIYKNDELKDKKISFIKCDIEGGEESIIEDVLYFAYYNKAKVYMSFHLDWWEDKDLSRFEYLFKFFKTNCSASNIIDYIKRNPFTSILFEPLEDAGVLIKKNMPIVIIGYNQITYIKNMIAQLEKYTADIILVDNNSTYPPLLDYYQNEFKYTLLKQSKNYGYLVYQEDFVQKLVGSAYILTDPDLQLNKKLPDNFIKKLIEISNYFKAYKVGFALCIDSDDLRSDVQWNNYTIYEWEKRFWTVPLEYKEDSSLFLYSAPIDTTFCFISNHFRNGKHIRVAGDYTCLHIPWLKNFKDFLTKEEIEYYLKYNNSTSWFKN